MPWKDASHRFTTEKPGWSPYFNMNEGYKGMTLDELLKAADYTFTAKKLPTYYRNASGDYVQSEAYSVVRTDNYTELGKGFAGKTDANGNVESVKGFHVIQLSDALHRVLDPVMEIEKDAYFVNLLGFDNGAKVSISLRLPGGLTVNGESLDKYLNFVTGFDGQNPLTISWNLLRPVCWNTFNLVISEAVNKARFGQGAVKIRHTANMEDRLSDSKTREILGLADKSYQAVQSFLNHLAETQANEETVSQFIRLLLPPTGWKVKDGAIVENAARVNQRNKIKELVYNGEGQDPSNVTYWSMFNAVTQWVDWNRRGEDSENPKTDADQARSAEEHPLKARSMELLTQTPDDWKAGIEKINTETPKMTASE